MAGLINKIFRVCIFAIIAPAVAFGGQSPRAASSKVLTRNQSLDNNTLIRRSATSVIARSTNANSRRSRKTVTARPAVARTTSNISVRSGARVISSGSNVSRSAVSKNGTARSAIINKKASASNVSRAAVSRATAVFDDVTKIGGGYANCRDAYATCMDQFCAVANDTYRRCYCSDKFSTLRDTSDNIDQALNVLISFQNENLEAVNKTAAEVSAMYTSTAGENAIRKDTSASQKMLDEIGDILSGKKSKSKKNEYSVSTGILDFGDLSEVGDMWSTNDSTVFNSRAADNITGLEGYELYKRAGTQCAALMGDICSGDSMFNLASSAYSIMVTQDCNILEKSINAKKENVVKTVKQAEQLLRQARLEEYRAHNSQDVNECLTRVEVALLSPVACGSNYEKCLDYTGLYIDGNTGKPISHQLFNLTTIAPDLGGEGDIIEVNPRWDAFLEGKKMFATTALDTCRSLADIVWTEYKRSAMIRIAQMQDAKIEEFKNSCVQTIKECYNTNDETLNLTSDTVTNNMYDVGAGRAITVRDMCYQEVMACAAMYGGSEGCEYDKTTRKITTNKKTGRCGLQSLLAYVDTVDSARVAQGCETVLVAKAHNMCDPVSTTTSSSSTSRSAVSSPLVARAATGSDSQFVECDLGEYLPKGATSCSPCKNGLKVFSGGQRARKYCPGGTYTKGASADQGIKDCPDESTANSEHTDCINNSSSTTEKYPAGCKSWSLQTIYNEIYYHANEFCAVDLAKSNRANTNFDDTTLNMQIIDDAIFNVFFRLCKDLGYSNETCEKYRNKRAPDPSDGCDGFDYTKGSTCPAGYTLGSSCSTGTTTKYKCDKKASCPYTTTSCSTGYHKTGKTCQSGDTVYVECEADKTSGTTKDPVEQLNEKYQEDVVADKGAGYDMGSIGGPKADATIKDSTTLKEQMEMYLGGENGIISQVGRRENDYYGMVDNRYEMLDMENSAMGIGQTVSAGDPIMHTAVSNGNSSYNSAFEGASMGAYNSSVQQTYGGSTSYTNGPSAAMRN